MAYVMNTQAIIDNLGAAREKLPAENVAAIDAALQLIETMGEQNKSLRWLVGRNHRPKSEKVAPGQLELALVAGLVTAPDDQETSEDPLAGDEGGKEEPETGKNDEKKKPTRKRRKTNIKLLPVEVHEIHPEANELICTEHRMPKRKMNCRVVKQVIFEPARLYVREEHIYEYACDLCGEEPITGDATPTVVPGSLASSSLLSHLVVAKTIDANPVERARTRTGGVHGLRL